MDIWNLWETKAPPTCTAKTVLHHKEINNLKELVFDVLQTLQNIEYLHKEAALLSRYLYKNKRTFRQDKGTQYLVKIHQCLKRYLRLNFKEIINNFKQTLPAKLQASSTHAYLPTRQMLRWILLRLLALSQIFKRLIDLSKAAGYYLYGKICLGWASYLSLILFCMMARILTASKFILLKSIEWYNALYKCQPYLELTTEFLSNFKFPADLKPWLGDIDVSPPKNKTSIDKVFEIIDLVRDEDEEKEEYKVSDKEEEVKVLVEKFIKPIFKSEVEIIDSDVEEVEVEKKETKRKRIMIQEEDLGIPIDNEEEDIGVAAKKPKKNKKNKKFKKQNIRINN